MQLPGSTLNKAGPCHTGVDFLWLCHRHYVWTGRQHGSTTQGTAAQGRRSTGIRGSTQQSLLVPSVESHSDRTAIKMKWHGPISAARHALADPCNVAGKLYYTQKPPPCVTQTTTSSDNQPFRFKRATSLGSMKHSSSSRLSHLVHVAQQLTSYVFCE